MTIETKYNVGDEVWFQYDCVEPTSGIIEGKSHYKLFDDDSQAWAIRLKNGSYITKGESKLHATEGEALIESAMYYEALAKGLRDKAAQTK